MWVGETDSIGAFACRIAGYGNSSQSAAGSYSWACRSQYSQQSSMLAVRSLILFI